MPTINGINAQELQSFAYDANVDSAQAVLNFVDQASDPLLSESQRYELLGQMHDQQFQIMRRRRGNGRKRPILKAGQKHNSYGTKLPPSLIMRH